ncbi:hypothetical protein Tco_0185423 [Tanacetum coccineum]
MATRQALYSDCCTNNSASSGSTSQETQLPHAFNTLTLQDPANSNWNMDTGASSHLNSSVNNLSTIFNSRIYPSVLVGDGKSIPVTNTGQAPTNSLPGRSLGELADCISLVRDKVPTRDGTDSWQWMLEDGGFTVKRFKCGRIPIRTLLDNIGMDLHSTLCPHYEEAIETIDHSATVSSTTGSIGVMGLHL